MFDLIESLILSDVTIILLLVAMLGVVTSWAMRQNEYPGYLLGWLAGILLVIVYRTLGGDAIDPVPAGDLVEETEVTLNFFTVLLSVVLGLLTGFFMLVAAQRLGVSYRRGRRGLTIAVMTAGLIVTIFALTIAGAEFRRTLGLFALSVAVGSLSFVVLSATPSGFMRGGRSHSAQQFRGQGAPPVANNPPPPVNNPPPTARPPQSGNPQAGGPPPAGGGNPPQSPPMSDVQRRFEELRRKAEGRD